MGIEVYWSQLAETKIEDIFYYYKLKAGTKIARKNIIGIIDATIDLDKNPQIGQMEELLKDRPQEFRYLLYSNYKIVYWHNKEKNRIVIANVFDTRQNPDKLQQTI